MRQKNHGKGGASRYETMIREFALTLYFYSPRGYRFVRKTLSLPAPSTLRSWASKVTVQPGFLTNVLLGLKENTASNNRNCIVIVDEMSIRSETIWDDNSSKFVGTVDYGGIQGEHPEKVAQNALVVMAVGLRGGWRTPIAYFLTKSLTAEVQSTILKEAITLLTEAEFDVHGVVFDGTSKNTATAKHLGCSNLGSYDGEFSHPSVNHPLYIILDVCHMLKLARNAAAHLGVFYNKKDQAIRWEHITNLHKVQQKDILHLANKLTSKHIHWQNHKMKVKVAAQTLSHSVASAIKFLRALGMDDFRDADPTAEFILYINNLFDILNTRSRFGKGFKSPITVENLPEIETYVKECEEYLGTLRDTRKILLSQGPRKTFILGFLTSAKSILAISKHLLTKENGVMSYILTYRFSQDMLEMFFSKVRSRNGWNNNPNAVQLKYALRSLLLKITPNRPELPLIGPSPGRLSQSQQIGTFDPRWLPKMATK